MVKVGIIGGTGLDNPDILKDSQDLDVNTEYGKPSSQIKTGKINGVEVSLLARHGKEHSIMPTNVPYQANIQALKNLGCTHIIATTACGSLRERIQPGDLVFIDQFIDRTTKRKQTFYEKDKVCHIPMGEPFCADTRRLLADTSEKLGIPYHRCGTMITIEGPRFSTKAESNMFRQWGADVINMSTVPEAVLAREAGICYAVIAMSTDYDCWRRGEKEVNIELILETMKTNAGNAIKIITEVLPLIKEKNCICNKDIRTAVL